MSITIEKVGRRYYLQGNTYPIRQQVKEAGCKWDSDRREWWTSKKDVAEGFTGEVEQPKEDLDSCGVQAKVRHKGKTFYIIAESRDGQRRRICALSGEYAFWVAVDQIELVKVYRPRKQGYGRYAREGYQTLGSLRRFIEDQRQREESGAPACCECGKRGELHEDLEDGGMKCYGCCDIPR